SGYPEGDSQPWAKAKAIQLNDALEGKAEGTVSYPNRQRAKWYYIDLTSDGKLTATVTVDPRSPGADVNVEILDSGYNVVSKDIDDAGQPKKTRIADKVTMGKAYIHL